MSSKSRKATLALETMFSYHPAQRPAHRRSTTADHGTDKLRNLCCVTCEVTALDSSHMSTRESNKAGDPFFFLKPHPRICLLISDREEGGGGETEKERRGESEREKHQYTASCTCPDWGSNPQPRYVP